MIIYVHYTSSYHRVPCPEPPITSHSSSASQWELLLSSPTAPCLATFPLQPLLPQLSVGCGVEIEAARHESATTPATSSTRVFEGDRDAAVESEGAALPAQATSARSTVDVVAVYCTLKTVRAKPLVIERSLPKPFSSLKLLISGSTIPLKPQTADSATKHRPTSSARLSPK